jgi:transaldolase/glucose-6-phosphate isomerase
MTPSMSRETSPLGELEALGQSVWSDNMRRALPTSGELDPELLYVESLTGEDTVDTIPPVTYEAFKAHGTARATLSDDVEDSRRVAGDARTLDGFLSAQLSRAEPGGYVGVLAYVPMTRENERLLSAIRVLVRDHLRAATCVGFGPRFQHSTGQVCKGGPNSGVFPRITCGDTVQLAVPGHAYTFGTVEEAQARGDFDVLAQRGRRALRVDVGTDATAGLAALRDAGARVLHHAGVERED